LTRAGNDDRSTPVHLRCETAFILVGSSATLPVVGLVGAELFELFERALFG